MMFTKVSFFMLYLQLFGPMRPIKICSWIGGVFPVVFYSTMTICTFIFATPDRNETWFNHQTTAMTAHNLALSVPQACFGTAIDVFILILPIAAVLKLQLPTRKKVGLVLLFAAGLLEVMLLRLHIWLNNSNDTS